MRNGTSLWWHVQSRNKKSVTCDLRRPEGQEIVRRLARERAHRGGELPPRRAGEMEPRLGRALAREPEAGHGAHLGLRPDRPVPRPAGLRRHRRGDGRLPLRHRLSRPAAGAAESVDRRHHRLAARRDRRADGAAQRRRRRQGPGGRRRALRSGVQLHGEPAARVRRAAATCASAAAARCPASRRPTSIRARTATCSSPATPTACTSG